MLNGNKILTQIGSVEAFENELDQVMRKNYLIGEKCEDTEDVEYIEYELEVSTTLRNWRSVLLNRRQELMKEEHTREKVEKLLIEYMKTLVLKDNIQVKLRGPSNCLA